MTKPKTNPKPKAKARKKTKKAKGEAWKHDHVSGKAHPDNLMPLQKVAQASPEAAEKETAALDAVREKETKPDWAQLPGGRPPEADGTPVKATKTATTKTVVTSAAADKAAANAATARADERTGSAH